jgi:DNA-binding MarR family transcriptional regulator
MVSHGLVERLHGERDRRQVIISLTRYGDRMLRKLSAEHIRQLREMGPALVAALDAIVASVPVEQAEKIAQ